MGEAPRDQLRTAVVIVHGMGEQLPLDTLNRFVATALPRVGDKRLFYSRPERVTDSYEARRLLAFRVPSGDDVVYGQTEFFEYHWSYMMTDNHFGDLMPAVRRLLLRPPWKVPSGLRVAWVLAWLLIIGFAALLAWWLLTAPSEDRTLTGLGIAAVGAGGLWVIKQLLSRVTDVVTRSFVDVVRYLDRSPRSYEARRAIRGGMVDLLQGLHDKNRYARIVVVGHSLGAYIAYDGISYLWPQLSNLHCGPIDDERKKGVPLAGLAELQDAAEALDAASLDDVEEKLVEFRSRQFELWRGLRLQGNPWLITDFISVGTPMYFADLLYTKNRAGFIELTRRAELPVCPPISATRTVEGKDAKKVSYGFNNRGRTVLGHGTPFAVVRWTNLFFPVKWGLFGDWFGGQLRPLFGNGVEDVPLTGNTPGRWTPALAHSKYFAYPDELAPGDVAPVLRERLDLALQDELVHPDNAPAALAETDEGGVVTVLKE